MFIVEIETENYPGPDDLPTLARMLREVAAELEDEHADTGIEPVGIIADSGEVVGKYEYQT